MAIPEAPPQTVSVVVAHLWRLGADPAKINSAAQAWRRLAMAARDSGDRVDDVALRLRGDAWSGATADSYHAHRARLTGDLDGAGGHAEAVAAALEGTAALLRSAQGMLDDAWSRLNSKVAGHASDGEVTFRVRTPEQADAVEAAMREANEIRADVDSELSSRLAAIEQTRPPLAQIAQAWRSVSDGASDGWQLPPEATNGTSVIWSGNQVIVNTGTGNDTVEVRVDPQTGEQIVVVNGVERRFPAGYEITVRAGEGNDNITVPAGSRVNLTLLGGDGNDQIRSGGGDDTILAGRGGDRVWGGEGNDRVSGESGNDYLDGFRGDDTMSGGAGDDTIYGLSGNDKIFGNSGRDYLEGAAGDDIVDGGADADVVSGGRDNDTLRGGGGDDKVYGGHGRDTVAAGPGNDTAYVQAGEDVTDSAEQVVNVELKDLATFIEVEGSDEFKERIQADLDMLRASPRGQMMLAELDDIHNDSKAIAADWPVLGGIAYQGNTLTITEFGEENGEASYRTNWHLGEDYKIKINPAYPGAHAGGQPVTVLFHELAHVYDYGNNTSVDGRHEDPNDTDVNWDPDRNEWVGVPNDERQAVGLPIDHDDDPSTPTRVDPDHPFDYTENGLRDELGLPPRTHYGQPQP
ncbi:MAG TPA: M91 family zinc metallopeptidase [Pilimelia sp.]|nr:M91 family zinc metallopeptidase [Pilimelia sp.]